MADSKKEAAPDSFATLQKVLSKHYDSLVAAGSDAALLKSYSSLLKYLKQVNFLEKNRMFVDEQKASAGVSKKTPKFTNDEISNLPIGTIEKLINDQEVSRELLESIAIHRFKVPKGSMRSFSNRRMLVEKLMTLASNEAAHLIIDTVARGEPRSNPDQK